MCPVAIRRLQRLVREVHRVIDAGRESPRWHRKWCLAVQCWAGFGYARVLAGELAYGAGYFLAHESNVTQVPVNPVPEWIQSLIAGFAYRQNTVDFDARL